ncbi:MAG TPA: metallophosphoesterase [Anaerolineae bacterium]|nr:metallophosphoesterase [Anaerolineae bacterium]
MFEPVYFVQISDTHIGPSPGFARHGHVALPCAQRLVDIINRLPHKPDFVIHTGDVVNNPDRDAYQLAAETFAGLHVPVYYVNGNHDQADMIHKYMRMGPKTDLIATREELVYGFEVKGHQFVVLDSRAVDEIDPRGTISEEQVGIVRKAVEKAKETDGSLTVFIHHPVLRMNSVWMDAYMLLMNGEVLHRALLPAENRLRGVFLGHVHQNMQTVRDGVMYVSVASAFSQFSAWPGDNQIRHDPYHLPGYNFVHLLKEQTVVHQHSFMRP